MGLHTILIVPNAMYCVKNIYRYEHEVSEILNRGDPMIDPVKWCRASIFHKADRKREKPYPSEARI